MIGYFLKAGDESVSEMFSPYIWKEHGFGTLFENAYINKSYGNDLKLILIMYYVEGAFNINGPENLKVNNYSNKKKDISVAITVLPNQFHNRNEFERREFIVDSTLKAVKLVRDKLSKKKNLDIKFEELISDVIEIGDEYLRYKKLII
ncbi:MAG: hypothetical protein KGM16_08860 [Bacteroidota bacterium]|nr:hypothetical protein [Bacteroidota bacterium]